MNRKISISRFLVIGILAAGLLFALGGCDLLDSLFTVNPQQRAESFITAMNSTNRAGVRDAHIHEDAGAYDQIGEEGAEFWNIPFPTGETGSYALSDVEASGSTVTATLTSTSTYEDGVAIVFNTRLNDDGDAMILSISIRGQNILQ
ncbi:hypothetical protein [Spirochaeta dissipatitropha]